MQVVKVAALITDDRSNSVRFKFGQGTAGLSAVSPEVGESREEMEIDYNGDNLEIAFNPYFIIDVLKALDDEDKINLQLINSDSPGIFKTDGRFLCVIMPMKL
jgi:DNA polymerase-3 subunit beta